MTRRSADVQQVILLLGAGLSQAEVVRRTGVPRGTVQTWIRAGTEAVLAAKRRSERASHHDGSITCELVRTVPPSHYSYLLGLYLGDGCLSATNRTGLHRLRIALDLRYPEIIAECQVAMAQVLPNKVGVVQNPGCVTVNSYSRHWVCMFPQHGRGPKHLRRIILQPWQEEMAVLHHPRMLLRGLIHSDGYRGENRIKGRYAYPRYSFSNRSDDIRQIFIDACGQAGISAKPNGRWQVSVSRREDVALMDSFVGPKR